MTFPFDQLVFAPGDVDLSRSPLAGKVDAKGKTVGVVISGGNVDPAVFARALAG